MDLKEEFTFEALVGNSVMFVLEMIAKVFSTAKDATSFRAYSELLLATCNFLGVILIEMLVVWIEL